MRLRGYATVAIGGVAILLGLTTSAQAGPPLICHPFDIGTAKTPPPVDWNQKGSGGYDLKNLTRDTLAILTRAPRCSCKWKPCGAPRSLLATILTSRRN